jgi:hypothetical protein
MNFLPIEDAHTPIPVGIEISGESGDAILTELEEQLNTEQNV